MARKKEKDFKYYRKDIVKKMGSVGTYNKSFDHIIDVYSNMLLEYNQMLDKFNAVCYTHLTLPTKREV